MDRKSFEGVTRYLSSSIVAITKVLAMRQFEATGHLIANRSSHTESRKSHVSSDGPFRHHPTSPTVPDKSICVFGTKPTPPDRSHRLLLPHSPSSVGSIPTGLTNRNHCID